jgi:hypothetical protein
MTDEQIKTCIQEIAFQVTSPAAFGDDGASVRLLAMELLDYREAREMLVAKGYSEPGEFSRGMPGTPVAELVRLLPDKAMETKGRCCHCADWIELAVSGVAVGVCMGGEELSLHGRGNRCDYFKAKVE